MIIIPFQVKLLNSIILLVITVMPSTCTMWTQCGHNVDSWDTICVDVLSLYSTSDFSIIIMPKYSSTFASIFLNTYFRTGFFADTYYFNTITCFNLP